MLVWCRFLLYSANNATVDYITLEQGKARKIFQAESDMYNVAGTEPVFIRDNDNLYFHTEQSDALYEIKDLNLSQLYLRLSIKEGNRANFA